MQREKSCLRSEAHLPIAGLARDASALRLPGARARYRSPRPALFPRSRDTSRLEWPFFTSPFWPISRVKGHGGVSQIACDRRCKLMRSLLGSSERRASFRKGAKLRLALPGESRVADLLEIVRGHGSHIRTRQASWLISLPEENQ